MRPVGQQSFVNFGTPQLDNVRSFSSVHYFEVLEDFYWSTHTAGIAVGDPTSPLDTYYFQDSASEPLFEGTSLYTIFDTGSSEILVSQMYYMSLIHAIFNKVGGKDWTFSDGELLTKCYTNFPSIFFAINGKWLELGADDYVADVSFARDRSQCAIRIKSLNLPYIVLGNPFFIDYYVIHEADRSQMGVAPHTTSSKRDITPVTSL